MEESKEWNEEGRIKTCIYVCDVCAHECLCLLIHIRQVCITLLFGLKTHTAHGVNKKEMKERKKNAQSRKLVVLAHDLSPYLNPTSAAVMVATDRHEPIIVSF